MGDVNRTLLTWKHRVFMLRHYTKAYVFMYFLLLTFPPMPKMMLQTMGDVNRTLDMETSCFHVITLHQSIRFHVFSNAHFFSPKMMQQTMGDVTRK